jgi:predicted NAD/FAD-dependent oxidoreductase
MGRDWTNTHLENDAPFTAALLLEEVAAALGERLPPTRFLTAHRWRFARARTPVGAPCVGCDEKRLWAGGDWALGRQAEDAWMSGRDMARQVIETMAAV